MSNIASQTDTVPMASSVASDKPVANRGRRPPLLVGLVMIALVAAGYLGWRHLTHGSSVAAEPPLPVPVIAATVKQSNFPIVLTGIGNVTALNTATVRSMVTEPIVSIDFKDGQSVKKGELLAQLDPSTYQAQLDQAQANLARDEAHLENGQINLGRYVPLPKQGFAPQQQVATQQAMIAQEQATLQSRPGGDRICQDRAELIPGSWRRSTASPEFACSMSATSSMRPRRGGFPGRAGCLGRDQPGAADQRDVYLGRGRHSGRAGRSRKGPGQGRRIKRGRQDRARCRRACRDRQSGEHHLRHDKSQGNISLIRTAGCGPACSSMSGS